LHSIIISLTLDHSVILKNTMDSAKEETTSNKCSSEEDSIPDCNRSSDSGDEAWMLIEVEKFQDVLDESFLNSAVTQKSEAATKSPLETVVDELADLETKSQGSVEEGRAFGSLVSSEHSNPQLFSSNNSHSSVESAHSHTHSHSRPHTMDSDLDPDSGPIIEPCPEGLQQGSSGGCSSSINASEMFRDYFNQHSGNTPAVTSIPDLSQSEDEDDDEEEDGEAGMKMAVEAMRLALQKAEEEGNFLRDKVHSLLAQNLQKDTEIQDLRRSLEEKEQLEQMKLLEKSTSTITHTAPGPTADTVVSLRALTQRVRNLERETRQTRLLDEQRQGESGRAARGGVGASAGVGQDMRLLEEEEEKGEDVLSALIARLGEQLSGLENELIPLVSRLQAPPCPSQQLTPSSPSATPQEKAHDDLKISLRNFAANDIALFFPTPKGEYLAFNIGAPHHFLSAESKALIGQDQHFKKLYVLGRIVMVETQRVEGATTPGGDAHPKGLAKGMQYHALSVASVADQLT